MSACCNNGFKMIHEVIGFKMWLGLIGPAGPAGPAGKDVQLRGPVATVGDLPTTAPASELWQVGTQAPYNGYFFNGEAWISLGPVAAGTTFTPTVSSDGVISWTNDGGLPNPESVNIKGPQGPAGADGSDGVTFTPAVSSAGVISWTNDGSLPNPEPVNIKGPQGQTGPAGPGVPSGGSAGQVLKKQSATDYDSAWGTDNTVIISDTQPSASDNKLWVDTDSSNGDSFLIPTMADMNAANAAQDANIGIVQTGSTATQNITKGQYVIWNGALYIASAAIASGATLSSSNLTAVGGGGLNALLPIHVSGRNGYIKFPDGMMMEWGVETGIAFNNEPIVEGQVTYPVRFYSTPLILASTAQTSVNEYLFRVGVASDQTVFSWTLGSGDGNPITITNRQFNWLAIGLWK